MKAILWIFGLALVAFSIHFASFAFIPATRGPSVRVSHGVLRIAEQALGNVYLTDFNPEGEYPGGSLHANPAGQKVLLLFWSLVYLLLFSLGYSAFARPGRSRVPPDRLNRR